VHRVHRVPHSLPHGGAFWVQDLESLDPLVDEGARAVKAAFVSLQGEVSVSLKPSISVTFKAFGISFAYLGCRFGAMVSASDHSIYNFLAVKGVHVRNMILFC
jgi:hypothetical protein